MQPRFRPRNKGQSLIEYILFIALIAIVAIAALSAVGRVGEEAFESHPQHTPSPAPLPEGTATEPSA